MSEGLRRTYLNLCLIPRWIESHYQSKTVTLVSSRWSVCSSQRTFGLYDARTTPGSMDTGTHHRLHRRLGFLDDERVHQIRLGTSLLGVNSLHSFAPSESAVTGVQENQNAAHRLKPIFCQIRFFSTSRFRSNSHEMTTVCGSRASRSTVISVQEASYGQQLQGRKKGERMPARGAPSSSEIESILL